MLALTLIQPWATLIVHHGKNVENRTWPTRHRGPLLIHAGLKTDADGYQRARELGIHLPDDLPAGGIIGQIDVIDCVRDSRSRWAAAGQWHWLLANPVALPFEPARGQCGLWHHGPRVDDQQASLFGNA